MNINTEREKRARVAKILDNPVYLPGSKMRELLENALVKKLSMHDLYVLALIVSQNHPQSKEI